METLADVVVILKDGAQAFRSIGTEKSPGTKLFSVSGCVQKPGNFEVPLSYPLMELIDLAGGLREGRRFKSGYPWGVFGSCFDG